MATPIETLPASSTVGAGVPPRAPRRPRRLPLPAAPPPLAQLRRPRRAAPRRTAPPPAPGPPGQRGAPLPAARGHVLPGARK